MTGAWIILIVFVLVVVGTAAWAGWRAAPFVPTLDRDVKRMMDLAELKPGDRVVDLGAGDGRIIIAAVRAQPRITAVGYELAAGMWLLAWLKITLSGCRRQAATQMKDFYHQDLSGYDVVFCFLMPKALKKLEPKLRTELRPGARVISAVFPFPNWPHERKEKPDRRVTIFMYRKA